MKDTPLGNLNLSRRTYNLLKRNGIETVSQLITQHNNSKIEDFRGIGEKTLKEIENNLANYRIEGSKNTTASQKEAASPPNDINFKEDKTPITKLDLTINQYGLLNSAAIRTIEDLFSLLNDDSTKATFDFEDLQVIKSRFVDYVRSKPRLKSPTQIKITNPENKYLLPLQNDETPLEYLCLSKRTFNSLKRSGINTVGELSILFLGEEIKAVRNIGENSAREIEERIKDFSENSKNNFKNANSAQVENVEEISCSLFVDIELLKRVSAIPLNKIPIDRLVLSNKLIKVLKKYNIYSIGDFYIQSRQYPNYENIKLRLERYLNWIAKQDQKVWKNEMENKGLSPLHFELLNKATLDDLVDKWFHSLNEQEQYIIRNRFGITGEIQTLEEIGNKLGKTRERIRQIQKRALTKLQSPKNWIAIEPLVALCLDWIKNLGGLISKTQLSKYTSLITAKSQSSPIGVGSLIFELDENITWLRATEAWGLKNYPLEKTKLIQQEFERILIQERTGLTKKILFSKFKSTETYKENSEISPPKFFMSCFNVNPNIEVDDRGECKLTKWSGKRLDEMIQALRQIGEPAHYSVIAERTNFLLPIDQQATPRLIHAHMDRLPDIFVRVGHGIFGLAEWGLHDDGNIANAVVRILNEENQLLPLNIITSKVLENWRVNPESVNMAIINDNRIIEWESGQYGLAEWEIERSKSQEEDLLSWFDEWSED